MMKMSPGDVLTIVNGVPNVSHPAHVIQEAEFVLCLKQAIRAFPGSKFIREKIRTARANIGIQVVTNDTASFIVYKTFSQISNERVQEIVVQTLESENMLISRESAVQIWLKYIDSTGANIIKYVDCTGNRICARLSDEPESGFDIQSLTSVLNIRGSDSPNDISAMKQAMIDAGWVYNDITEGYHRDGKSY